MSDVLLDVQNLWVSYVTDTISNKAVNGISFSINRGETLGFVGETGAGKTTSALSILRLLPKGVGRIDNGSVMFDEKDLLTLSEAEMRGIRGSRISMIFQDPMTSLNPVLTVGEQIAEVLRYHSDSKSKQEIEGKVDELLTLVGIPAARKKEYPHQFSGGMKQRVVIAIAVACSPELLIADEPTTALDVTIQAQVLDVLENLKGQINTAMLLITHDLGIVAQVCDKVAILYSGEIVEYGSVFDIFEGEMHHPYTRGLMGSIPNLTRTANRLNPIKGQMTDPSNLPPGCKFNPRCDYRTEVCQTVNPSIREVSPGHLIKCGLFEGGEA
jgi:peptide/nickel transport system ATP-binding protein